MEKILDRECNFNSGKTKQIISMLSMINFNQSKSRVFLDSSKEAKVPTLIHSAN